MEPQTRQARDEVLRRTYASLRWLLFLLPVVLFVVTVGTALHQGRLEPSISAYYGGPVRDVFVGVMLAVAACLIAYQGEPAMEDYNLNGAGFYAVFVALVPHNLAQILDDLRRTPVLSPDGFSPADYVVSLRISLSVVLLCGAALLTRHLAHTDELRRLWRGGPTTRAFLVVTQGTLFVFVALTAWQLFVPAADEVRLPGLTFLGFPFSIHHIAAVCLIAALAVAVWSHGWPEAACQASNETPTRTPTNRGRYRVIFWLMLLGPVPVGALAWMISREHLVLLLEWWEIGLFCAFWALESWRLRRIGRPAAQQAAIP